MFEQTVSRIKQLYVVKHQKSAERAERLRPIAAQARDARGEYHGILALHGDLAHQVAAWDMAKIARYVRPEILPLVRQAFDAARLLAKPGTEEDVMKAITSLENSIDEPRDNGFDHAFRDAERQAKMFAASVGALVKAGTELEIALSTLERVETLAAEAVNVPTLPQGSSLFQTAVQRPEEVLPQAGGQAVVNALHEDRERLQFYSVSPCRKPSNAVVALVAGRGNDLGELQFVLRSLKKQMQRGNVSQEMKRRNHVMPKSARLRRKAAQALRRKKAAFRRRL